MEFLKRIGNESTRKNIRFNKNVILKNDIKIKKGFNKMLRPFFWISDKKFSFVIHKGHVLYLK